MNRRRRVGISGHGTGGEAAVALELYMEMKSIPPPPAADDKQMGKSLVMLLIE